MVKLNELTKSIKYFENHAYDRNYEKVMLK